MLSGGLDSVYSLYRMLKEVDDEILVHHVHLINPENRHIAEARSCELVMDYCRQEFGDIPYSESTVDHSMFNRFGYDMFIVAYIAGIITRDYAEKTGKQIARWICGNCLEEGHGNPERSVYMHRISAASSYPFNGPRCDALEPYISKADQVGYLPKELAVGAWSCRNPVWTVQGPQECGQCHTCEIIQPARKQFHRV